MRTSLVMAMAAVFLGGASVSWAGQKADPTPDWRCTLLLHDREGDTIRSDRALPDPTYRDGFGGVTCYIVNEPGTNHDRWLYMSITGTRRNPPTRVVKFVGQTYNGAEYKSFDNHGTFEVKKLANVTLAQYGTTGRDVMPFRAYLRAPNLTQYFADGLAMLRGDSNLTVYGSGAYTEPILGNPDLAPTSSVFVQPITACSWTVTSNPGEGFFTGTYGERAGTYPPTRVMRITEGSKNSIVRGDFPMPFAATVTITSNTTSCPQ